MARSRLLLVAILTLAIPVQAVATVAAELCTILCEYEAGTTLPHDHGASSSAAHDHTADHDASGATPCGPCTACCATACIVASPKLRGSAVPQAGIAPALLPSRGRKLPRKLDRPPLAL